MLNDSNKNKKTIKKNQFVFDLIFIFIFIYPVRIQIKHKQIRAQHFIVSPNF